jgi:hypothetical protein
MIVMMVMVMMFGLYFRKGLSAREACNLLDPGDQGKGQGQGLTKYMAMPCRYGEAASCTVSCNQSNC